MKNKRAIAWGIVAAGIAYWINLLLDKAGVPETWAMLLIVPVTEEVAKYLGLRRCRSWIIPAIFLIGETVVQSVSKGGMFLLPDAWLIWLFYLPFGIVMLKHILFYVVMYLCDFGLHGLVLAIAAHSVWNWYAISPTESEGIPLSLVVLAVTVLPVFALYKHEEELYGNDV